MTISAHSSASVYDRLSICGVTLRKLPFEEQARVIAESGCKGMGLFHGLMPEGIETEYVRGILDQNGLQASICVPKPYSILPTRMFDVRAGRRVVRGPTPATAVSEFVESLRWVAPLKPATVLVIAGAQGDMSAGEAWDTAREGLVEVADAAGELGIQLALEPIHPRFATDFSIVASIDEALQMIDDVGRPNLGVLIETFHVWNLSDLAGQIQRARGRINGVQMSDSRPYPRSIVDRLVPGEGSADVNAIVGMIEATGYTGWYDSEVVSDDGQLGYGAYPDSVWHRAPEEIARACVEGCLRALSVSAS